METHRHLASEDTARIAGETLRGKMGFANSSKPPVGLILGTGWGDALEYDQDRRVPFSRIPGFEALETLKGHAREVVRGRLGKRDFIALRGRVHLNERPADASLHAMVRLQVEMLLQFGVKDLILTCAAGSLNSDVLPGQIMPIDGFITLFAPDMPLFAGEFCSPEDVIDQGTIRHLMTRTGKLPISVAPGGGYAMVRGPYFEGRKYDKKILRDCGASAVGMSVLPEACVAALYPDVRVLPLAFITNTAIEEHSHESNMRIAREASTRLGSFLSMIPYVTKSPR